MPARLLLDEHISPDVVGLLGKRGVDAVALREWHDSEYLSQPDEQILLAAHAEGRTLVTFDVHSIPLVLRHFAEAGIDHGGVIFISVRTIGQGDISGMAAALGKLAVRQGDEPLTNQVLFLQT